MQDPFFASDKVVFFDKYILHLNKFLNDSLKVLEEIDAEFNV